MKFGKLASIKGVDFRLPDTAPGKPTFWNYNEAHPAKLWLGGTGWGMKEWLGILYTLHAKPQDYLYQYSRQFNTIELNTTHYQLPPIERVSKWVEATPPGFRFCPKVWQRLSHSRDLGVSHPSFSIFWDSMFAFGDRLGVCFLQLPPYFGYNQLPVLEHLLHQLPAALPIAIEFRHESWFQADHFEQVATLLERQGIGTVLTDVAGRRDVLHMRLSSPQLLLRLVGNGLDDTDFQRADDWIQRVEQWRTYGLEDVYLFVHQHDDALVPTLANYFCHQLAPYEHWQTQCLQILPQFKQGSLF